MRIVGWKLNKSRRATIVLPVERRAENLIAFDTFFATERNRESDDQFYREVQTSIQYLLKISTIRLWFHEIFIEKFEGNVQKYKQEKYLNWSWLKSIF